MHRLEGHRWAIRSLVHAPGNPFRLVSGGDDRQVHFWNPVACEHQEALPGHGDAVLCFAFTQDGQRLASGSRDGTLCLWNLDPPQLRQRIQPRTGAIIALGWDRQERDILAAVRSEQYTDRAERLLRWTPGDHLVMESSHFGSQPRTVESACFARDGWGYACAELTRRVIVCAWSTPQQEITWECPNRVRAASFVPHAEAPPELAVATGRVVQLWNLAAASPRILFQGHRSEVLTLAFSADHQLLLTGSADRSVRLWEVSSGRELAAWDWKVGRIHTVAIAPDGLTAACGGEKNALVIWDLG